jgi:fumarate reductase flavoprotein subunit
MNMNKKVKALLSGLLLAGMSMVTSAADESTDVLVIGGGGAGLSAAIAAKENGANVIIVEKMPMLGGNTNYATGGLNASETELQKQKGVHDTNQKFYDDTMKGGKFKNNPSLVKVMTEKSAEIVKWLGEKGADLTDLGRMAGQGEDRTHRPKGGAPVGPDMVDALATVTEKENITTKLKTKAVDIQNDGNKKIVTVEGPDGKTYEIEAKSVVIATGGFGANPDMVVKFVPELKGFGTTNHPGATGDGIGLAEKVGADFVDMKEIQTHPTVVPKVNYMITEAVRGNGAILVNRDGKRFVNELETRDVVSKAELDQKGGTAYLVFDDGVRQSLKAIDGYKKRNLLTEGATPEELANKLNIPADEFKATIDKYNKFVNDKKDAEFDRNSLPRTLVTGPFYAVEVGPAIHHTMGGITINEKTEVQSNGKTVPGIYAAGEVTGGVHGANRLGGNAMTDITVFGKIAGEQAAEYSKTVK